MSEDIPMKKCTGPCGQEYPATTEYWHRKKDRLQNKCKSCVREYQKEYLNRAEVKNHRKKQNKEYREREDVQNRRKEWQKEYISRPEVQNHKKEHNKKYREEYMNRPGVKEHKKERMKKWRKEYESRLEVQKHKKEYLKKRRSMPSVLEIERMQSHNRRARKKSISGTYTTAQIQDQLKRQKHKCYYCKVRLKKVKGRYIYHIEHTFPLSRVAGTDIPANSIDYLVLSCPTCNLSKGDKFPWEWAQGGRLL